MNRDVMVAGSVRVRVAARGRRGGGHLAAGVAAPGTRLPRRFPSARRAGRGVARPARRRGVAGATRPRSGLTGPSPPSLSGSPLPRCCLSAWSAAGTVPPGRWTGRSIGTGWLLALVAAMPPGMGVDLRCAVVFAIHAAVAVRVLGVQTLGLVRLSVTAYTLVVIFAAFAAVRPMFRASARITARRAELASRSAAERAATAAVQEDRGRRLAVLEAEVLPLLRAIADGSGDPTAAAVREQCGHSAAMLRHALADRAGAGGELLTEFEPVLRAAGGRGVPVETQVVGDPGVTGPQVIHATTAALERILHGLPPQPVVLTVLATVDEVELYLTFRISHDPLNPAPRLVDLDAAAPPGSALAGHDRRRRGRRGLPGGPVAEGGSRDGATVTTPDVPGAVIKVAAVDDHPIVLGGISAGSRRSRAISASSAPRRRSMACWHRPWAGRRRRPPRSRPGRWHGCRA